jgi:hypothetical protein
MVVQQLSRHLCTRVSNFHFFMSKSKFSSPLNTSPHSKFQWRVERNRKVKNVWKNFATRRHTRRAASACRTHESLEQTTQKKLQLMTKKMQMRRSQKMVMTAILVLFAANEIRPTEECCHSLEIILKTNSRDFMFLFSRFTRHHPMADRGERRH